MEYEIGADEPVSTAVVRAVSAVQNCKPKTLRPLSDVLDPDALDSIFGPHDDGTPRIGGRLSFVYGDCRVTVDNGEYLTLRLLEIRFSNDSDSDAVGPERSG